MREEPGTSTPWAVTPTAQKKPHSGFPKRCRIKFVQTKNCVSTNPLARPDFMSRWWMKRRKSYEIKPWLASHNRLGSTISSAVHSALNSHQFQRRRRVGVARNPQTSPAIKTAMVYLVMKPRPSVAPTASYHLGLRSSADALQSTQLTPTTGNRNLCIGIAFPRKVKWVTARPRELPRPRPATRHSVHASSAR